MATTENKRRNPLNGAPQASNTYHPNLKTNDLDLGSGYTNIYAYLILTLGMP